MFRSLDLRSDRHMPNPGLCRRERSRLGNWSAQKQPARWPSPTKDKEQAVEKQSYAGKRIEIWRTWNPLDINE
ncbi:hypothetical protein [Sulfitobacter sp. M36]|uniref:hypothetical protein n=1 Tax=Sulfitobacter sp. M36 TaxID=2731165 RepID=UPI0023E2CB43|nr:hypothetical protein [Sulfitobacter sp. M36]MDF3414654.1 hypothetical protein [Sulfitobacter sp. KE5]MDF3532801.1 hypothetical protein [Sulfitobacter sp. S62]